MLGMQRLLLRTLSSVREHNARQRGPAKGPPGREARPPEDGPDGHGREQQEVQEEQGRGDEPVDVARVEHVARLARVPVQAHVRVAAVRGLRRVQSSAEAHTECSCCVGVSVV